MTDDDLTTRLRRIADRWGGGPVHAELLEAADRIDELEAENERLRAEVESGRQGFMALHWLEKWRRGAGDD